MNHYSYSSFVSCDNLLKMDEGISNLNNGAKKIGRTPTPRQIRC